MPTIGFSDLNQLEDVLLDDRYELLLNPKGGNGSNNMEALTLRCQQAAIAGTQIEQIPVGLNGITLHFRGRRLYPYTLAVAYVETRSGIVSRTLRQWMEYVVGSNSNDGSQKKDYSITGNIKVYNEGGEVGLDFKFINLWPMDVPDAQVNGSAAQPMLIQATFSYDKVELNGVQLM